MTDYIGEKRLKIFGTENNGRILCEIGTRIKNTRIAIGYTQRELSARAGISQRTLERLENGENVNMEALMNVMRSMNLLQNFDILIPEQEILPTELHDRGRRRMRVGRPKKSVERNNSNWKWGDEK